jgi:DNA-binding transcriptional regulator YiaG
VIVKTADQLAALAAIDPGEIVEKRRSLGLTTRELAAVLDVREPSVGEWELGWLTPPRWLRFALAGLEQAVRP